MARAIAKLKFPEASGGLNLTLPTAALHSLDAAFAEITERTSFDTPNRQNGGMRSLAPALLLVVIPLSAQLTPNPEFRETAVIPAFHRRNPNIVHFQTFYRKDLDGTHTLLLIRGGGPTPRWRLPLKYFWWNRDDLVGLFLMKTGNPDLVWELAILANKHDIRVEVVRADNSSIVLSRFGDYCIQTDSMKLFFDVTSKRVLKRVEFAPLPVREILALDDDLYVVVGSQEQTVVVRLDEGEPILTMGAEMEPALARAREAPAGHVTPFVSSSFAIRREYLPIGSQGRFAASLVFQPYTRAVEGVAERVGDEYKLYELPKSTYEEFARARPRRVKDGYRPEVATFEEVIGTYQIVGDRFWFGKAFYDGEGLTGVGGFGYFDPKEKKYVVFSPPEVAPWSASALLVEGKDIWLGLARHPEGATYSGGLLRYERDSGQAEEFDVGEVISQIKRWQGWLYLATANGLYILQDDRLRRHVFEPTLDGGTAIFKSHP